MTVPYLHFGFYYYRYEIEFSLLHEKTIIKEIKQSLNWAIPIHLFSLRDSGIKQWRW